MKPPTKEELIQAAAEFAKKEGWRIEEYTATGFTKTKNECRVEFEGKSKRPGDHFTVYLECDTGKVQRLVPGR